VTNLNICIDIDGTVTDPYYWLSDANRYFNRRVGIQDITCYDIKKVMRIDKDAYDEFYHLYGEDIHWKSAARPGTKEVINRLSLMHHIHFVSARGKNLTDMSRDWLKQEGIPSDSVSLLGSSYKVKAAQNLNCDLFIEDCLSNALELAQAKFNVLLVDCNYNRAILPPQISRVYNWSQIESYIRDFIFKKKKQLA